MEETESLTDPSEGDSSRYNNPRFWAHWVKQTKKKAQESWWNACKAAWEEYEACEEAAASGGTSLANQQAQYPIFWSSIKTVRPAFYSRKPRLNALRRFDINDDVAGTASKISERLSEYSLDVTPFQDVMRDSTMEFILSDWCTNRVIVEGGFDEEETRRPLSYQESEEGGAYFDGEELYEGEVFQDEETGEYFYNDVEETPVNDKCYAVSVGYDEILWTSSAKAWDEVQTIAFRFAIPEDQIADRFSVEIPRSALRGHIEGEESEEKKSQKRKESTEKFLHGWEIWHKPTGRVYWFSPDVPEILLDNQPDPYELRGFFPCTPFQIGTKRRKSLYGRPAHVYLRGCIDQLRNQASSLYKMIRHARVRGIGDKGACPEITQLVESADENEWIFVETLQSLLEKGGIDGVLIFFPTEKIAAAIQQVAALQEKFKRDFDEFFGIPDILRGVSDPLDAMGTQQIKSFNATNRFREGVNQLAECARCTMELLNELKLNAYTPEKIERIVGKEFLDEDDQDRFPEALQMLTSDEGSVIRLDIETDSTSYIHEQVQQGQRNAVVQTTLSGLKEVASIAQAMPSAVPVVMKTLLYALSGMPGGKDFEDEVLQAVEELQEQQAQPQQPQQPDAQMLMAQVRMQEVQLKGAEMERKQQQQQFEQYIEQQEQARKDREQAFMEWATSQGLNIDQYKAQVQGQETMMEEQRLAYETQLKGQKQNQDFQKAMKPETPAAVVVNNVPPAPQPAAPVVSPPIMYGPEYF